MSLPSTASTKCAPMPGMANTFSITKEPVSAAAVALGVSHQRVHELIKKEIEAEGSGLRAKKFNKTILVFITDIEKRLDMPKSKGGRPKKNNT